MNKRHLILAGLVLLLAACGSTPSWDQEEVTVVSTRLLADDVKAVWNVEPAQPNAAGEQRIRLVLTGKDGGSIDAFERTHEKLLHLIVISRDLSYFRHLHPDYLGDGVFEIVNTFPAGGAYRLIADFKPSGGDAMTKMEWVRVAGTEAKPVAIHPDAVLENVFDGYRIGLTADSLAAQKEVALRFTIREDAIGMPVTNLEPYLGAIGHVVIVTEDGERYLHVHAEEGQGAGPEAVFETTFPKSGVYKIWAQFQRNQQVFTASFVVNVP